MFDERKREVEWASRGIENIVQTLDVQIRDLIATREGAWSATLATIDDKIEEREVSEESMCIKEIGEWAAFLIFFKPVSSSVVNGLNLRGLGRGTTPCLERILSNFWMHARVNRLKDLGNPVTWKSDERDNQPEFLMCRSNSEAVGPGIYRMQTYVASTASQIEEEKYLVCWVHPCCHGSARTLSWRSSQRCSSAENIQTDVKTEII